jgi:hypothetical protein
MSAARAAARESATFTRLVSMPVYAQGALQATAAILPADSQLVGSKTGQNASYSNFANDSCQDVTYSSDALASTESQVNPSWTGDRHKVSVTLCSGNATSSDGSDHPFGA